MVIFEACIIATVLLGFLGMIFKTNLMMTIFAMDIMSTGVIAFFVLISARGGVIAPIYSSQLSGDYADPVPQAVILTAIVIGFSIQALMLVCTMRLSRNHPLLESREIERSQMP